MHACMLCCAEPCSEPKPQPNTALLDESQLDSASSRSAVAALADPAAAIATGTPFLEAALQASLLPAGHCGTIAGQQQRHNAGFALSVRSRWCLPAWLPLRLRLRSDSGDDLAAPGSPPPLAITLPAAIVSGDGCRSGVPQRHISRRPSNPAPAHAAPVLVTEQATQPVSAQHALHASLPNRCRPKLQLSNSRSACFTAVAMRGAERTCVQPPAVSVALCRSLQLGSRVGHR